MTLKTAKLLFGGALLLASIGVLLSLTAFSDIHNIEKVNVEKNGEVTIYADKKNRPISGVIMVESKEEKGARTNIPVKDGLASGLVKQFNGDAKKIAEFPFVNGILEGAATFYDHEGNIIGISLYSGNRKEGKETVFTGSERSSEAIYAGGELQKFSKFNPDGTVEYEVNAASGEDTGALPPPLAYPVIQ